MEIDNALEENCSLNYFQLLLDKVNKTKCCQGAVVENQNVAIKASFGPQYVQSSGRWRHINCLTIIKESEKYYKITLKIVLKILSIASGESLYFQMPHIY